MAENTSSDAAAPDTTAAEAALPTLPTPPRWDLTDLYPALNDPRIDSTLTTAQADAEAFAARYRGSVAALTPEDLYGALVEYESIQQDAARPIAYANLYFSTDATPEVGAFFQRVRERTTAATLPLLFFDLELTRIPAERLQELADHPALARYRHYLLVARARAPFRLTEPEERILEEQANTGRRAFVRMFEELSSNQRFTLEGDERTLTLSDVLDLQLSPNREERRRSSEALTAGFSEQIRTVAFIFNTLMQDKATEDRLRGFTYQEQSRHLANELSPEVVETVVSTAEQGYTLVARFYEAKRRALGMERLYHYDRYAPISATPTRISYEDAREICLSAFAGFDPEYATAARAFFEGQWIDAEVRPGKRGGAYCSYITPDVHPYIFVNYLNKQGDVRTLAHELGHGIHTLLARDQGFLSFHGTLPIAEVASTFAEQLVFEQARQQTTERNARLALFAEQIEQAIATIFRQAALYRFEQAIHRERRSQGELTVERFGELWQENVGAMFGSSIELLPGHSVWWSYVRHFVATPFYVYAYTAGEMLALALFRRYQQEGTSFAPRYLDMLRAGGSQTPAELTAPLGADLTDATFWRGALEVLEEQVAEFEALAGG